VYSLVNKHAYTLVPLGSHTYGLLDARMIVTVMGCAGCTLFRAGLSDGRLQSSKLLLVLASAGVLGFGPRRGP
jgi:hypothetical protein